MERLVTIVCAAPDGVVGQGRKRRKPWMAPGALIELAAFVRQNPDWNAIAWDETAEGPVPLELLLSSQLVMLTGLTPSYERMNEIARYCVEQAIPLIAGGRDVIGWSREPGGLDLLTGRFPSFCTSHVTSELIAEILDDCGAGQLRQHYSVPDGTPYEFVVPDRSVIVQSHYHAPCSVRSEVGCLNNCPWCTVGGQGQFYKPVGILKAELKTFHHWFFLDTSDSLGGNSDATREVLRVYKESGMKWGAEITVEDLLGKDKQGKLIAEMKAAGCVLLYIGIESITREVHHKSSRKDAERVIELCRRVGIIVIGSLILDVMGDETAEEIKKTIYWAKQHLDFAQFSLTALLPGCALRIRALRDRTIIESDWRRFDGVHPTMAHTLPPERRSQLLTQAYKDFSTIPWVLWRAIRARGVLKLPVLYAGLRYRRGIPQF